MFFKGNILNFIFILSAPIISIGILKLYYIIIPGEKIGSVGDWISFAGGYVGAIVALVGIWWQIKYDEKKLNKQNSNFFLYYFENIENNLQKNKEEIYYCMVNKKFAYENEIVLQSDNLKVFYLNLCNNISDKYLYFNLVNIFEKLCKFENEIQKNIQFNEKLPIIEKLLYEENILDNDYFSLKDSYLIFKNNEKIDNLLNHLDTLLRNSRNQIISEEDISYKNYKELHRIKLYYKSIKSILDNNSENSLSSILEMIKKIQIKLKNRHF